MGTTSLNSDPNVGTVSVPSLAMELRREQDTSPTVLPLDTKGFGGESERLTPEVVIRPAPPPEAPPSSRLVGPQNPRVGVLPRVLVPVAPGPFAHLVCRAEQKERVRLLDTKLCFARDGVINSRGTSTASRQSWSPLFNDMSCVRSHTGFL